MILELIIFMLPAYIANMTPVFTRHIPILASPVDFGKSISGKRILGDHKTWRGIISGILAGILTALFLSLIEPLAPSFFLVSYTNWAVLGALLSAGALLGDLLKSFFKRQLNIPSGKSWIPFDQIDYSIGALILALPLVNLGIRQSVLLVVISAILHLITNIIGYYLNIRKQPW